MAVRPKRDGPPLPQGDKTVRPKAAASLILIRRDADSLRVLMGRRHSGHAFMPDRWVFPGGRMDRGDHRAPAATELAPDVVALFERNGQSARARGLALAAIRETFEEAGLLIATPAPTRPGAGAWRPFLAQGALPDLSALEVLARAITPPDIARRYDTWFFMAEATRLLSQDRQPDCGELDEIAWITPPEADALPLPGITRLILAEAIARLDDSSRPRPSFRFVGARRMISAL
ncbi:NUDIX hydrolase [Phenylobacterium immobile]|uniref:NUDIX hydrolase n=1 Tax=Phenylobacterium immobile TaxID=21 RepID=UPI000A82572B|nr:NUDIX hydrolase [Phenylobacterium immobile]